jgi:hypothetical protein
MKALVPDHMSLHSPSFTNNFLIPPFCSQFFYFVLAFDASYLAILMPIRQQRPIKNTNALPFNYLWYWGNLLKRFGI